MPRPAATAVRVAIFEALHAHGGVFEKKPGIRSAMQALAKASNRPVGPAGQAVRNMEREGWIRVELDETRFIERVTFIEQPPYFDEPVRTLGLVRRHKWAQDEQAIRDTADQPGVTEPTEPIARAAEHMNRALTADEDKDQRIENLAESCRQLQARLDAMGAGRAEEHITSLASKLATAERGLSTQQSVIQAKDRDIQRLRDAIKTLA